MSKVEGELVNRTEVRKEMAQEILDICHKNERYSALTILGGVMNHCINIIEDNER